jgi:hypothetical protein
MQHPKYLGSISANKHHHHHPKVPTVKENVSYGVQKDPALSRAPKIGHSRKNKKHLNKPEFEYKRNIDRRGWGPFAIRNVFEGLLYGTAVCNAGCNPCAFLAGYPPPPQKEN